METIPDPFTLCNPKLSRRKGFRVPFGLREGRVWAPAEVQAGKACNCVCPACNRPLAAKAKTSKRRRPHFAHLGETDCQTGGETGIHLRAKQVIQDRRGLLLPPWVGDLLDRPNPPVRRDDSGAAHFGRRIDYPALAASLSEVHPEARLGAYQPDLLAVDEAGELLIEIRVTHAVDDRKAAQVRTDGRRMVEIDLSTLERDIPHDPAAFEQAVLWDVGNRHWICCPAADADWRLSMDELERHVAERNRKLAEVWAKQAALETERQEQLAGQARDKAGRREYMRKRLRAPLARDLEELPRLTDPARIAQLRSEYRIAAAERVRELSAGATQEVRTACSGSHWDDWIFGVDPELWQLLAYEEFVGKREGGQRFNQRDVASWVRMAFPYERALYRLFATQYARRAESRRAGYAKHSFSFWAFTDEENARIPNFYEPINQLVQRMEKAQLIRIVPGSIGECEVIHNLKEGCRPTSKI